MKAYPLYFSFTNVVATATFQASVVTKGRALLIRHEGELASWVCRGVEPGGLDAEGDEAIVATKGFSGEFQAVLMDLAESAGTFEGFAHRVEAFFEERNEEAESLWAQSVAAIREGRAVIDPSLDRMERKPEAEARGVEVTRLPSQNAEFNDQITLAADIDQAA